MFNLEKVITEWREQMVKAGIKRPDELYELEGHLRDEVEQQLRLGLETKQAFRNAVEKLGHPQALKAEFRKVPESKGDTMNHNRVYTATLWVFAIYNAMIIFAGLFYWRAVGGQMSEPMGRYPGWMLRWMFVLTCVYTVLIVWTLFARRFRPQLGRRLSRVLNWALLPAIPGGTVIGLYGLLAADKNVRQSV